MIDIGLITAGGEGRRMKETGIDTPKPLVKVQNKELISYPIDSMIENGIKKIVIIEPWNMSIKEKIIDIYKNKDVKLIFEKPSKKQQLFDNLLLVEKYIKDKFIMSDADIILTTSNLEKFISNLKNKDIFGAIATVKEPNIQFNHYLGIENDRITRFDKEANIGYHGGYLYMFKKEIYKYIKEAIEKKDYSYENFITNMSRKEMIIPSYIDDIWDVDCYGELLETEQYLKQNEVKKLIKRF